MKEWLKLFTKGSYCLDGPSTKQDSCYDRSVRQWVNQNEPYNSAFSDAIAALQLQNLDDVGCWLLNILLPL